MPDDANPVRAHLLISGRVQGVFYRATTQREASQRGLTGWVRNLPDGRVEATIEGSSDQVKDLIAWCRKGPAGAQVGEIEVHWEDYRGEFQQFQVTY